MGYRSLEIGCHSVIRKWLGMAATCVFAFAAAGAAAGVGAAGPDAGSGNVLLFAASSIPASHQPIIIALGEASHGGEAMLAARNQLLPARPAMLERPLRNDDGVDLTAFKAK